MIGIRSTDLDRYIHLRHLDASAVCVADRVECLRVSVVAERRWVGTFEIIWWRCDQNLTECLFIVSVDISTKLTFWGWLSEQALVINQSATWKIHSNGNWNLLISLYWNQGVALYDIWVGQKKCKRVTKQQTKKHWQTTMFWFCLPCRIGVTKKASIHAVCFSQPPPGQICWDSQKGRTLDAKEWLFPQIAP